MDQEQHGSALELHVEANISQYYSMLSVFLFAAVQQASLYGFASLLPIAYPQAVMTGESKESTLFQSWDDLYNAFVIC